MGPRRRRFEYRRRGTVDSTTGGTQMRNKTILVRNCKRQVPDPGYLARTGGYISRYCVRFLEPEYTQANAA